MNIQIESITLDGIDLPSLGGEQRQSVLDLVMNIRSECLLICTNKLNVGISMARLQDIVGHGPFEGLRGKFFPQIPKRSAQRYTAVGRIFGSYRDMIMDIGFANLGKLAEQENLNSLRTELIDQVERGKVVDCHYYRSRIAELLNEAHVERQEQTDTEKMDNDHKAELATKAGRGKSGLRNRAIDEYTKDIVDRLIPTDPEKLRQLWEVLNTVHKQQQVTHYMYKRVSDLVNHMESDPVCVVK